MVTTFKNFLLGMVFFPLDLLRLTVDSWRFFLEGYFNRFTKCSPEQRCLYCINVDSGIVPRVMWHRIRYRNLWMVRLILPEIEVRRDEAGNKIPVCMKEGGHVVTPWYIPFVCLFLFMFWLIVLLLILVEFHLIPEEANPFTWLASFFPDQLF